MYISCVRLLPVETACLTALYNLIQTIMSTKAKWIYRLFAKSRNHIRRDHRTATTTINTYIPKVWDFWLVNAKQEGLHVGNVHQLRQFNLYDMWLSGSRERHGQNNVALSQKSRHFFARPRTLYKCPTSGFIIRNFIVENKALRFSLWIGLLYFIMRVRGQQSF